MRQSLLEAIDSFNTDAKLNIQLGIGLEQGNVWLGMLSNTRSYPCSSPQDWAGFIGNERMCFDAVGQARTNAERLALCGAGVLLGARFKTSMDIANISSLFAVTPCTEFDQNQGEQMYRLAMHGQETMQALKVCFYFYRV